MQKEYKLFEEVKSYDDLKNVLKDNIECLHRGYFGVETLEVGIQSLNNLSIKKQAKLVDFSHFLDESLTTDEILNNNAMQKIPVLLASCIYYDKYEEEFEKYSMDAKVILSKFSVFESLDFYEQVFSSYTPEILDAVARKSRDYMLRDTYMRLIEKMISEKISNNRIIDHFEKTDDKDLMNEAFKVEREIEEEIIKGVII